MQLFVLCGEVGLEAAFLNHEFAIEFLHALELVLDFLELSCLRLDLFELVLLLQKQLVFALVVNFRLRQLPLETVRSLKFGLQFLHLLVFV